MPLLPKIPSSFLTVDADKLVFESENKRSRGQDIYKKFGKKDGWKIVIKVLQNNLLSENNWILFAYFPMLYSLFISVCSPWRWRLLWRHNSSHSIRWKCLSNIDFQSICFHFPCWLDTFFLFWQEKGHLYVFNLFKNPLSFALSLFFLSNSEWTWNSETQPKKRGRKITESTVLWSRNLWGMESGNEGKGRVEKESNLEIK